MKRVALVTGGSRGIGLGIAKCLAKQNFDLAINGMRKEEDTSASLEELKALGADVLYCRGDVGSAEERQGIMAMINSHYGRLNVLVNNAGVAPKERKFCWIYYQCFLNFCNSSFRKSGRILCC